MRPVLVPAWIGASSTDQTQCIVLKREIPPRTTIMTDDSNQFFHGLLLILKRFGGIFHRQHTSAAPRPVMPVLRGCPIRFAQVVVDSSQAQAPPFIGHVLLGRLPEHHRAESGPPPRRSSVEALPSFASDGAFPSRIRQAIPVCGERVSIPARRTASRLPSPSATGRWIPAASRPCTARHRRCSAHRWWAPGGCRRPPG